MTLKTHFVFVIGLFHLDAGGRDSTDPLQGPGNNGRLGTNGLDGMGIMTVLTFDMAWHAQRHFLEVMQVTIAHHIVSTRQDQCCLDVGLGHGSVMTTETGLLVLLVVEQAFALIGGMRAMAGQAGVLLYRGIGAIDQIGIVRTGDRGT